jgi:hypothetical protein
MGVQEGVTFAAADQPAVQRYRCEERNDQEKAREAQNKLVPKSAPR